MAQLESFLTLREAAAKYKISAEALTHFANSGKIRAVRLNGNGGEIAVAEEDVRREVLDLAQENYSDLEGRPIRVTEAAKRYNIPHGTLSRWAKANYIRVLERGPKLLLLNEADVARARDITRQLEMRQGRGVLTGPVYATD